MAFNSFYRSKNAFVASTMNSRGVGVSATTYPMVESKITLGMTISTCQLWRNLGSGFVLISTKTPVITFAGEGLVYYTAAILSELVNDPNMDRKGLKATLVTDAWTPSVYDTYPAWNTSTWFGESQIIAVGGGAVGTNPYTVNFNQIWQGYQPSVTEVHYGFQLIRDRKRYGSTNYDIIAMLDFGGSWTLTSYPGPPVPTPIYQVILNGQIQVSQ